MDVIKLLPTLVINREDAEHLVHAFDQVMGACHRFPGPVWEVGKRLQPGQIEWSTRELTESRHPWIEIKVIELKGTRGNVPFFTQEAVLPDAICGRGSRPNPAGVKQPKPAASRSLRGIGPFERAHFGIPSGEVGVQGSRHCRRQHCRFDTRKRRCRSSRC